MGFRIFLHSVRLVFGQMREALRISGVLFITTVVLFAVSLFFFYAQTTAGNARPAYPWHFVFTTIISLLLYLWIAVGWHRFVLLDEVSTAPVPAFLGDRLLAYFGRWIQLILIGIIIGVVSGLLFGLLGLISNGSPVVAMLAIAVIGTVVLLITYRLAPMFPGAAIGRPLGVGEAWAATSGASGSILVLAIISTIAAFVIDLPMELFKFLPLGWLLISIWAFATSWIKLMVGISILTAVYGVYVEKRALPANS